MRIEKKLFGTSFSEMILLTLFILVLVNVLAVIASFITGIPYLQILSIGWFLLVVYPIGHGVIQSIMDKNGMLKISEFEDFNILKKELKTISRRINYQQTESDDRVLKFNRRTKLGRMFNVIFREDFTVVRSNGTIEIYGKQNALKRIERRFQMLHPEEF
jgi:hypothetical protein